MTRKKNIDAAAPSPIADANIPAKRTRIVALGDSIRFGEGDAPTKKKRGRPRKNARKPRDTVRSLRLQLCVARDANQDELAAMAGRTRKTEDHLRALTHLYNAHRKYLQALAPFIDVGVLNYGIFP